MNNYMDHYMAIRVKEYLSAKSARFAQINFTLLGYPENFAYLCSVKPSVRPCRQHQSGIIVCHNL